MIGRFNVIVSHINYHNSKLYDFLRSHWVFNFIVSTGALEIIHANVVKRSLIKIGPIFKVKDHPEELRWNAARIAAIFKAFGQYDLILGDMKGDFKTTMHSLGHVYLDKYLAIVG